MSSQNTTTQALPDTELFAFLNLPAELRNRIYAYTFTPPLGYLELFDLLEPIPGEALLYTCKQIRAEANPMYDAARAQIDWRNHMFWLNPNNPQFDGSEGHVKLKKIVRAIEALNANELRQVQYVSIPTPVLIPDGKERYFYSDGVWECSHVYPFPIARHSPANSHPRYAIMTDRCHNLSVTNLANQNVVFADEIGTKWTIFLNLSTRAAANAIKGNWGLTKVELEAAVAWYLTEKVIQQG